MVVYPVMPTLRRLRKEDQEFEARLHTNFDASLGHMKPCRLTTERRWETGGKRKVRCSSQTVSDRLVSHRCNIPGRRLSHPDPQNCWYRLCAAQLFQGLGSASGEPTVLQDSRFLSLTVLHHSCFCFSLVKSASIQL